MHIIKHHNFELKINVLNAAILQLFLHLYPFPNSPDCSIFQNSESTRNHPSRRINKYIIDLSKSFSCNNFYTDIELL